MSHPTERLYSVHRLDGMTATVLDDEGKQYAIPRSRIPARVQTGDVLRVPLGLGETPLWGDATIDDEERKRRESPPEV